MATYVDIITGFLESGKTTFIKEVLNSREAEAFNKIVLLICEEGFTDYDEELLEKKNVKSIILENDSDLNDELFKQIFTKFNPDYIIVEYNGTWDISKLLGLKTPFEYKFRNIAFISEAGTFRNQLNNMISLMHPHIQNSNLVIFNRYKKIKPAIQKKLIRDIKNINPRIQTIFLKEFESDKIIKERFWAGGKQGNIFLNLKVFIFVALSLFLILITNDFDVYSAIQSTVTVFLSILMQATPFILLGAFISAGIQIFASTGWIMNQIAKGSWSSFLIAAAAGFFLPICDCGMVPIISGLLKKDTPLPQTITFWLASSAVSPIVILAMLYAFPEKPYLAAIRVVAGVVIGIVGGIILKLIQLENHDVLKEHRQFQNIGNDILTLKYEGTKGKIEAVFAGAKVEFFRVSEYVIIGALISAILQTILPQTMKNFIGGNIILQFLVMILAAMLMSTCSTSNAFIGRSFSNNFSAVPILAFIVMGPMLDLKNMVMLSEILKEGFLIFLACLVIIESAIVFGALAFFL
ncbi:permease [Acetobacterium bakii]|uniref:CobW/HypB/UreG nucleotide-binding domain-containing protein n=1 Tax=Acetobacterium bakii TaxID=52689 RepID=A0A0L6TXF7_9FIRM|nr:permease [Acetobacterium bakii]KNZ40762.1 hypothetical protein AKG39_15780 [Acetobacterium bakii]